MWLAEINRISFGVVRLRKRRDEVWTNAVLLTLSAATACKEGAEIGH